MMQNIDQSKLNETWVGKASLVQYCYLFQAFGLYFWGRGAVWALYFAWWLKCGFKQYFDEIKIFLCVWVQVIMEASLVKAYLSSRY